MNDYILMVTIFFSAHDNLMPDAIQMSSELCQAALESFQQDLLCCFVFDFLCDVERALFVSGKKFCESAPLCLDHLIFLYEVVSFRNGISARLALAIHTDVSQLLNVPRLQNCCVTQLDRHEVKVFVCLTQARVAVFHLCIVSQFIGCHVA